MAAPGSTREIDLEQLTYQATTLDEAETFLGEPADVQVRKDGTTVAAYELDDPWNRGSAVFLFFDRHHVLQGKADVEADEDQERT